MGVITLTTDWGYRDFYVGALKGSILKHSDKIQIVDISHSIEPHNTLDAAFILKQSYKHFPEGTVHIFGIGSAGKEGKFLAVKYKGHYFIGADEGIFSLIMDDAPESIVELDPGDEKFSAFISIHLFVPAAVKLVEGKNISSLGKPVESIIEKTLLQPVIEGNTIRGTIVYIDDFENLIVNVSRKLFDRVRQDRNFVIHFRKFEYHEDKIAKHYDSVSEGEKMVIFNSFNLMEIAVNRGKAASLLGLQLRDTVRIEFNDSTIG